MVKILILISLLLIIVTPELIRDVWQLKTVVFLHWCLIRAVLFAAKTHSDAITNGIVS